MNYKNILRKIQQQMHLDFFLLLCFCLFICFSFSVNYLNEDNYNYAIEELHAYDHALYSDNINVIGAEYSPKFFANYIMSLLMTILNCSWYDAAAILVRLNYIFYAIAAIMITLNITNKHKLLCGLLSTTALMTGSLISLGFGVNGAPDVFLGTAIPIAIMGIACSVGNKKHWLAAWILVTIAGLLHIHEGIWAGCIVGVLCLSECISKKTIKKEMVIGTSIYTLSILLIVIPSLIHAQPVDENLFVQIYAFIRTPHHLLLSAWGKRKILNASLLSLFCGLTPVICNKKNINTSFKQSLIHLLLFGILWCLLLGAEYIATEIHPSAALVTMYIPKCFKYITLIGTIFLLQYGIFFLEKKRYISATALCIIPLLPSVTTYYLVLQVLLFLVATVFVLSQWEEKIFSALEISEENLLAEFVYIVIFYLAYRKLTVNGIRHTTFLLCLLFSIMLFQFFPETILNNRIKKIILPILASCLVIVSLSGSIFTVNKSGITYINGEQFAKNNMNHSIYSLAKEFKDKVTGEIIFLADPDSKNSNAFQLISQKSCYVLYKNTPTNKNLLFEWYERILAARKITVYTATELKGYMDAIDVKYVLLPAKRFNDIEESQLFTCLSKNDDYAIFLKK